MVAKVADFEAAVPRDDVVPRAALGRDAQPWPSAVASAVAWLDLVHARPRAALPKLHFFTVLGHGLSSRSDPW